LRVFFIKKKGGKRGRNRQKREQRKEKPAREKKGSLNYNKVRASRPELEKYA
jgi:hypothetical protein